MKRKRLIAVINIKDDLVVQSFNYKRYLPLGRPEFFLENYNRWGADEILIQSIDSSKVRIPNFKIIKRISDIGISTPIVYAGGIFTAKDAVNVIKLGADRVILGSAFFSKPEIIKQISDSIGSQAIIISLPFLIEKNNRIFFFDYLNQKYHPLEYINFNIISEKYVSEILLSDVKNEGINEAFDAKILKIKEFYNIPFILFGGISSKKQIDFLIRQKNVSAIAISNFLSYKEHAYQLFKQNSKNYFRPSYFHL